MSETWPTVAAAVGRSIPTSYDYLLLDGERAKPAGSTILDVVTPVSGQVIGHAPAAGPGDIDRAVAAARRAFDAGPWPRMSVDARREVLLRAADILDEKAEDLNQLATAENGGLLHNRVGYIAGRVRYFASLEPPPAEIRVASSGDSATILHEPIGVVAAIVAWNGPINVAVSKIVPALLAGCTVVLKPAHETPLTSYPIAEALIEAGLPAGALNVVPTHAETSELLVRHPDVDYVSFTGGTANGKRVAAICADQVKRINLELGGKSPVIILDDMDLGAVAPAVLKGGMLQSNGQSCIAWTRILVSKARYNEAIDAFAAVVEQTIVGDPFEASTELGPLISRQHREKVEYYVRIGEEEGAVAVRGKLPAGLPPGWFTPPVLLTHSTNQMQTSREEIFGPVVSLIPFDDVDDAIRIANDNDYGLAAGVFTDDTEVAGRIARRLRSGTVGIKAPGVNVAFPFGGYKQSGIGRQHGSEGFLEYFEVKSVGVPAGATPIALSQERSVSR